MSPLKHFLRTRSDDVWPLIESTPYEKQKLPLKLKLKVSCFICIQLAHVLFQTSRPISSITKILSLTHRKCRSKPNTWILPPLSKKNCIKIRSYHIPLTFTTRNLIGCSYSRPNLIVVKYIHLSLADWLIHWPVYNILNVPTERYLFLQNNNSKIENNSNKEFIFVSN